MNMIETWLLKQVKYMEIQKPELKVVMNQFLQ